MSAGSPQLARWLDLVHACTRSAQAELDRLDAVAGDGDHGATMLLGWQAVATGIDRTASPGELLKQAGALFADVGGSSGPLWGTALLRAGRAVDAAAEVDLPTAVRAAEAALAGMCERGRCEEGSKTLIDAMAPAVRALAAAAGRGASCHTALAEAAAAAAAGAERTRELPALRGRASRFPERTLDSLDPGATSCALVWRAAAEALGDDRARRQARP